MSEDKKCNHQFQLIPNEDMGFEFSEGKKYQAIPDEDIPLPCHINMMCTGCYGTVKLQVYGELVHIKEKEKQ